MLNRTLRKASEIPIFRALLTYGAAVSGSLAIVSGGNIFRIFALGSVTAGLLLPLLYGLEAGMLAMIAFEPFRGILRRAQYLIVPYSQYEPIHLITPFVAMIALLSILMRKQISFLWETPQARIVFILGVICFAQIFNPLQGSLFVGMTGAMFYLVPMAWFYMGRSSKFEFFEKVFKFVAILALVTSAYGLYQITIGYPEFELYWLKNTDKYSSIDIYNVKRALATFSNAEEWGRYVQIGCISAFGFAMLPKSGRTRVFWLSAGLLLIGMLAMTGQRSSIFGLFLGIVILFVTGARSIGNGLMRLGVLCIPIVLIFTFVTALSTDDIYEIDESDRVDTILSHTARGTVDPTGEGSLNERFGRWNEIVTNVIPSNPFGYGLGAASMSASREEDKTESAVDNHFLSLAISAGVPAMLLLVWILFSAAKKSFIMWRAADPSCANAVYWRLSLALLSTFFLNNFFGTSFEIYSVAPLGWYLIGWVSAAGEQRVS